MRQLGSVDLLAACHPDIIIDEREKIEVRRLVAHPLLLLDVGFGFRRAFDAACRLARVEPRIRFESRSPHTLLALAEAGLGVAIIPSALRTDRYALRLYGVAYRGRLLRQELTLLWDKRRILPPYATAFCETWVAQAAQVLPISRPTSAGNRKPDS